MGGILVLEDSVQVDEDVGGLGLSLLVLETELLRDTESLFLGKAVLEADGGGDDSFWGFRSDLLDVHTSLVGSNKDDTVTRTVVQDSHVVFMRRVASLGQHDLQKSGVNRVYVRRMSKGTHGIADTATSTSLLGDKVRANHLASDLLCLSGAVLRKGVQNESCSQGKNVRFTC